MKKKFVGILVSTLLIAVTVLPVTGNMNIKEKIIQTYTPPVITTINGDIIGSVNNKPIDVEYDSYHDVKICDIEDRYKHIIQPDIPWPFFDEYVVDIFCLHRQPPDPPAVDIRDILIENSTKGFEMDITTKILYDNEQYEMIGHADIDIINESHCYFYMECSGTCPEIDISIDEWEDILKEKTRKAKVTQYETDKLMITYKLSMEFSNNKTLEVEVEKFFTYETGKTLPFDEIMTIKTKSVSQEGNDTINIVSNVNLKKKARVRAIMSPFLMLLQSHPNWFLILQKLLHRLDL